MTIISTEELSRQLNILNKVTSSFEANSAILNVAEGFKSAGQMSLGGISDTIPNLTDQVKNGISSELASQLTETLGGLPQLNSLFSGNSPVLAELGKLKMLENFGPPKGGVQALMKSADDPIDELDANSRPVLAKVDESMSDLIPDLKTEISGPDLANMDKIFSNENITISSIYDKGTPMLENNSAVTKDVYSDGSVEAIGGELKRITGKDFKQLNSVLNKLGPVDSTQPIEEILEKKESKQFQNLMKTSITKLETDLNKSLSQLTSGGSVKGVAENLTNNIATTLRGLGIPGADSPQIKNLILAGKTEEAINEVLKKIPVPDSIEELLGTVVITDRFSYYYIVQEGKRLASTPEQIADVNEFERKGEAVINAITPELGKLSGTVTTATNQTPSNPNPVKNSNKFQTAQTLNSEEEIVKLLQAVNREITSIKIIPGKLSSSWSSATASEYAEAVFGTYQGALAGLENDGPAHFFIRSDGTIETMRDLNKPAIPSGDLTGNEYLIELIYNNAGGKTTISQNASLKKIVSAFYKYVPVGEVYTSSNNSFDASQWIKTNFNKTNVQDPTQSQKYLSKEELIQFKNETSENTNREIKDNN